MPRISHKKIVTDKNQHTDFLEAYIKVIDVLQEKFPVTNGSKFGELVNFKKNKTTVKHSWFEYKQGYAEELVKFIIELERPNINYSILDPFSGVGTTNLVAQNLGYKSIGFDINPIAVLAAKTKTYYYSKSDVAKINELINTFEPSHPSIIEDPPRVILSSFKIPTLDKLYRIKYFCEQLEHSSSNQVADFFRLAFISIIEDCSIRTKDGNGIKLNLKKQPVENVYEYFLDKSRKMLADIEILNNKQESRLFNGSFLMDEFFQEIKDSKIGISIFSPPYANCFDYCEVYKLEFWMGGFVKDYNGFKYYRDMALRSHVNSQFNHEIVHLNHNVDVIANTISTYNIWNKNIPDMLRGYFDDMHELLKRLKNILVEGAACYIVVANSGYKGILVPTDLLIAEIAHNLGYSVEKILLARKIRSSSQQMDELHGKYDNLMRESILVIRK